MSIVSVNVSLPTVVEYKGKDVETSIFKRPVTGRAMVRELNLDGDEVELVERDPEPLTIAEVVDLWRSPASDLDRVRAALRVRALSASWREDFEGRLRGERST